MAKAKSGGSRKTGRNQQFCANYKTVGRREVNKRRKIERHLKSHPSDRQAKRAL